MSARSTTLWGLDRVNPIPPIWTGRRKKFTPYGNSLLTNIKKFGKIYIQRIKKGIDENDDLV